MSTDPSSRTGTGVASAAGWLGARQGRPAAAVLAIVLLALLLSLDARPERVLRHYLFDSYQQLLPRERKSDSVVVIAIDDLSLAEIGQWPWPRSKMAALVARVSALKPAAIGLDILFAEPDRYSPRHLERELLAEGVIAGLSGRRLPDYDERLAEVLREAGAVIGVGGAGRDERMAETIGYRPPIMQSDASAQITDFVARFAGSLRSIEVIDRAAPGHGIINALPQMPAGEQLAARWQDDGIVRQMPVLAIADQSLLPGFAVEILRQVSGDPVLRVEIDHGGMRGVDVGGQRIPTDRDGSWWIHYSPPKERLLVFPALPFVTGQYPEGFDPGELTNRVVLIGSVATGLGDLITTPLGVMPGVNAHAEALDNYFDRRLLSRPRWAVGAEAALFALLALIAIVAVPALKPLRAALLFLISAAAAAGIGVALFATQGWLIDVANPTGGAGLVFGFMVLVALSQVERQRQSLRAALAVSREEQARMEGELDAARRIQSGMLPNPREVLGDDPRVDLAALMQPARTVGGDLYDFFRVDGSRLFFMVGDVSGKGLPASLFMALSKALIKGAALHVRDDPGRCLSEAGRVIARENPEAMFVSVAAGVLDLDTGELAWSSAGHDCPYLVGRGEALSLETEGGPPLCMVDSFDYPSEQRRLAPGELLCLVTDGVTEAHNRRDELYGGERLAACLAGAGDMSSRKLIERLRRDVEKFTEGLELADDLTILVLRWAGPRKR